VEVKGLEPLGPEEGCRVSGSRLVRHQPEIGLRAMDPKDLSIEPRFEVRARQRPTTSFDRRRKAERQREAGRRTRGRRGALGGDGRRRSGSDRPADRRRGRRHRVRGTRQETEGSVHLQPCQLDRQPKQVSARCRLGLGRLDLEHERQLETSVPFGTRCFYAEAGSDLSTSEVHQLGFGAIAAGGCINLMR